MTCHSYVLAGSILFLAMLSTKEIQEKYGITTLRGCSFSCLTLWNKQSQYDKNIFIFKCWTFWLHETLAFWQNCKKCDQMKTRKQWKWSKACECSEVNHKFVLAEDFNLIKKPKNIHSGSKFIHQLLFEKVGLSLIEKIAFISKAHMSTRGVRLWCFSGFVDNGLTLDLDRNIPLIKIIIYNSCSHIIYLHVTPFLASYSVTPTFCVSSFTASMNLFIILCPVYPLSKPYQDASLTFLQTAQPELKY